MFFYSLNLSPAVRICDISYIQPLELTDFKTRRVQQFRKNLVSEKIVICFKIKGKGKNGSPSTLMLINLLLMFI